MGETSEVQNMQEPTVATEPLDAGPPATDVDHVQHGEPKEYPGDVSEDSEQYAAEDDPR